MQLKSIGLMGEQRRILFGLLKKELRKSGLNKQK